MTTIDYEISKPMLFKKYIILILTEVYKNLPSPARFDVPIVEKLTGHDFKSEEEGIIAFFETIDFLKREGYLRCISDYIKSSSINNQNILQPMLPVYISEKGINHLEKMSGKDKERIIDKFKKIALTISGNVATKVLTDSMVESVGFFLRAN